MTQESVEDKLGVALRKAAAFSHLMAQTRRETPVEGRDPSGAVGFHLTGDGRPDRVELDEAWRSRLKGESLAQAILAAHDAARGEALQDLVRPFAPDRFTSLDAVEVPPEQMDRFTRQSAAAAEGLIPSADQAQQRLGELRQRLGEAKLAAERRHAATEQVAATTTEPPPTDPETPVTFALRGTTVTAVGLDAKWEQQVPAARAQDVINAALRAALGEEPVR